MRFQSFAPMTAPFFLLTAFSTTPGGGNPAVVIFINEDLPLDSYKQIAQNFNQPIAAFVYPSTRVPNDKKTLVFNVRWFTPRCSEVELCGHGALAAAKAIFSREDLVTEETEAIEFDTLTRGIAIAQKYGGGFFGIKLPSANQLDVSPEEYSRISKVLVRTFGRDVTIDHIATGGKSFDDYLLVVLDEKENLKDLSVNANVLREAGFYVNVFATPSSSGNERFFSRMFAPGFVPGDEDHVCGTAHCVAAPYFYKKFDIPSGQEIKARQVSPRGGDLKLTWESDKNVMTLKGEALVLAKGELQLV